MPCPPPKAPLPNLGTKLTEPSSAPPIYIDISMAPRGLGAPPTPLHPAPVVHRGTQFSTNQPDRGPTSLLLENLHSLVLLLRQSVSQSVSTCRKKFLVGSGTAGSQTVEKKSLVERYTSVDERDDKTRQEPEDLAD
ncbi:hypothetical protein NEUTE2DRAFT_157915 [Neurospora tetrasperma FGSC 2509]|nr:hypothetical protein NEUTE2DRAFT_157915 [Neurospora tetrasperma FGSC 2509]